MTGHTGHWRMTNFLICASATEPAHQQKENHS
jgi:hypothetical protein